MDIKEFVKAFLKSRDMNDGVYQSGPSGFRAQPVFEDLLEEWEQSRQPAVSGALPLIPMPDGMIFFNGSNERCDALVGPCCCGAWHRIEDYKIERQCPLTGSGLCR